VKPRTAHDLRCTCPHHTKLAEYGMTTDGAAYLHVRVFKQGRVFGEVIASSGEVRVLCRDCGRWTQVNVKQPGEIFHDVEPLVLSA